VTGATPQVYLVIRKAGINREIAMTIDIRAVTAGLLLPAFLLTLNVSHAQEPSRNDQQRTRQAQAVSKHVYDKIILAQGLAEEEKAQAGLNILDGLLESDRLTDYGRSQVLQNVGRLHTLDQNMSAAIAAFEGVLRVLNLEDLIRKTTLYTLAQLHAAQGRHAVALQHLQEWFALEANPGSEPYILQAQNLYQLERYKAMIVAVEAAIDIATERGKPVKEDWYVLLSYGYFREENFPLVRDIHKTLIQFWPSRRYWLSLAGAYSELGDGANVVLAYDLAHTQGMLVKEAELVTMAQLYLQHEIPYKAARLLEAAIDDGVVMPTARNYRLLSQAWTLAREDARSIPALRQAASLSNDGVLEIRLGNAFLSLARYVECIDAITAGLGKGITERPEQAYVSLGMCQFYEQKYVAAIRSFTEAAKTPASRKTARAWIEMARNEMARNQEIAKVESKARDQLLLLKKRRAAIRGG
jgi:tetratricopeptide (TPR) repeat protein